MFGLISCKRNINPITNCITDGIHKKCNDGYINNDIISNFEYKYLFEKISTANKCISKGSSKNDVYNYLGAPNRIIGNGWYYEYKCDDIGFHSIIAFDNNKVQTLISTYCMGKHGKLEEITTNTALIGKNKAYLLELLGNPTDIFNLSWWFYGSGHKIFSDSLEIHFQDSSISFTVVMHTT